VAVVLTAAIVLLVFLHRLLDMRSLVHHILRCTLGHVLFELAVVRMDEWHA
jgi:hypothetical protein